MAFTPKITKARFVYSPFSGEQMTRIGSATIDNGILPRIRRGQDANDAAAKPLQENYKRSKVRKGGQPLRDLTLTGRTLHSVKVLSATENQVSLGPTDARTAIIINSNNKRNRQWGMSPSDQKSMSKAVFDEIVANSPVKVQRSN